MSSDTQLAVLEDNLKPLAPQFAEVLPPSMPAERIIRTVLVACEQTPYLLHNKFRQTLMMSAMSAAVLGLEVDGVTGQGYLIPFGNRAQFLAGYKGYVTIAARSGRTLDGFVVREGDNFEFDEANGLVQHRRVLGGEADRKILAAYAVSRGVNIPTLLKVMSIDEIMDVRDNSAGYKSAKQKGRKSTWDEHPAAMIRKTPMRRLANSLPIIPIQQAAALDTHHDMGEFTYVRKDGTVMAGGEAVIPAAEGSKTPVRPEIDVTPGTYVIYAGDGSERSYKDFPSYYATVTRLLDRMTPEQVKVFAGLNKANLAAMIDGPYSEEVSRVIDQLDQYD